MPMCVTLSLFPVVHHENLQETDMLFLATHWQGGWHTVLWNAKLTHHELKSTYIYFIIPALRFTSSDMLTGS